MINFATAPTDAIILFCLIAIPWYSFWIYVIGVLIWNHFADHDIIRQSALPADPWPPRYRQHPVFLPFLGIIAFLFLLLFLGVPGFVIGVLAVFSLIAYR